MSSAKSLTGVANGAPAPGQSLPSSSTSGQFRVALHRSLESMQRPAPQSNSVSADPHSRVTASCSRRRRLCPDSWQSSRTTRRRVAAMRVQSARLSHTGWKSLLPCAARARCVKPIGTRGDQVGVALAFAKELRGCYGNQQLKAKTHDLHSTAASFWALGARIDPNCLLLPPQPSGALSCAADTNRYTSRRPRCLMTSSERKRSHRKRPDERSSRSGEARPCRVGGHSPHSRPSLPSGRAPKRRRIAERAVPDFQILDHSPDSLSAAAAVGALSCAADTNRYTSRRPRCLMTSSERKRSHRKRPDERSSRSVRPKMSSIAQQKKIVEQLRAEASMARKPVSECVKDMIQFMDSNKDKDCLVSGFQSKKDNPFQEKGGCSVL
uniref:G protein gamma domain-containing protein n=2 Tax=Macrostomum lignano TaxID=282301 RepID=A0A1I8IY41_9PLAT